MFWLSWDLLDSAHRIGIFVRWELIKCALVACSFERSDNTCLTLESFGSSINELCQNFRLLLAFAIVIPLYNVVDHLVYPASRLNVVKSTNDDLKLLVEFFVIVLTWFY